jgi:Helix-turn-helix domain
MDDTTGTRPGPTTDQAAKVLPESVATELHLNGEVSRTPRFGMFPPEFLRSSYLSDPERRVLGFLYLRADKQHRRCHPLISDIAAHTEMSYSSVQRALRSMKERCILLIQSGKKDGFHSAYQINEPRLWKPR